MNEQDRHDIDRLARRQEALEHQLRELASDLAALHGRLTTKDAAAGEPFAAERVRSITGTAVPPPLPPDPVPSGSVFAAIDLNPARFRTEEKIAPPADEAVSAPTTSFEMRLGTYWLVRVGIVMLLTGLVFLGTYAYKNFIGLLGPVGKLSLLYTVGAALLGGGAWLQRRREKESLRNYGQVLFAGGLATVYFTTYAAHYIEMLRVIATPFLAGVLLFAWTAFIGWIADRKKSEVLALFAVGLAYYTSAITDVRLFTLYSNVLLTLAAVFFLVRNRWSTLSFVSLAATYGGFAFWRFYHGDWSWDARVELGPANAFLAGYWIMFTAAVFLARGSQLANGARALFATANNGAFFGLVLLSMIHWQRGYFWKFSLGFGFVLLALSLAAKRVFAGERVARDSYLAQGLVLITAGFIARFSGLQLALILACESVVLAVLGRLQENVFMRAGGAVTGAMSLMWTVQRFAVGEANAALGIGIGALLMFNTWWERRFEEGEAPRPGTACFGAAALATWALTLWQIVPDRWKPVAFSIAALALTFSFALHRVSEVSLLANGYAVVAQATWLFQTFHRDTVPWWSSTIVIAATVALSHWWQRQQQFDVRHEVRNFLQALYGVAAITILFSWVEPKFTPSTWLALANLLAIGLTLYAVLTRAWILAACSQAFLLVGSWEFVRQLTDGKPAWYVALAPVATWLVLGVMTSSYLAMRSVDSRVSRPLFAASVLYQWVAFAMSLWWVHSYFAFRDHFWLLVATSLALLAIAAICRSNHVFRFAAAYFVCAIVVVVLSLLTSAGALHWPNLVALVAVFVSQPLLRRLDSRLAIPAAVHHVAVVSAAVVAWLYISRWIIAKSDGTHLYLTASWAALAFVLFAAGFVLRERMHRWSGLAIVALAIGRVFVFDVWRLDALYRILSFTALGVVLLVLGFIYNKYQEKIRQWL